MGRASQIIVLAEDVRHQRFVYRYLKQLRYSDHDIRFEPLPSGRGCGEQWVRERYSSAVRAYRARSVRAKTALVVVIDADTDGPERRLRQFDAALLQADLPPRGPNESIAHLIPKRSIETWIVCLVGLPVDEYTDYRHESGIDLHIPSAAALLFSWARGNSQPPANCVPSLLSAIPEVRRLD